METIIRKDELATLIPHAGLMCLNENVLQWDQKSVLCSSQSHLRNDNPLRKNNKLSVVHAIEYCAQAMAVHGGLLAREQGEMIAPGYLAALRNVEFRCEYLDDIQHDLIIAATQLMAQAGNLIYEFTMYYENNDKQTTVATGRATVMQMSEAA